MVIAITTQHNDNNRTGANLSETQLTAANVEVQRFGRLYRRHLVGAAYAQPLLMPSIDIPSLGTRDMLYIATMHNYVYGFDATDAQANAPLWRQSLGPPIELPDPNIGPGGYHDISGEVGILSTPVISADLGVIYVVAATLENGSYHHRLHALDLSTGAERLGGPVEITGSLAGTGDGSVGGMIPFVSNRQVQRAGLLLTDDRIYIAFAAYGDQGPYHGWVFAYDARTLARVGIYVTTPNGGGGGIWQAGQAPASDGSAIFVMTGNGSSDPGVNLSCAFICIDPVTVRFTQWFAPTNWRSLDALDTDLGSGGPLLLPGTDLLTGGGKDGRLFLLKRGDLGNAAQDSKAVQVFQATAPPFSSQPAQAPDGYHHIHGSPVYWDGPMGQWIYLGGEADYLRAFAFTGSEFDTKPASISTIITPPHSMPGAIMSLSANGSAAGSGVLWASMPAPGNANQAAGNANQQVVDGILYALDASNLTHTLWHSQQNQARDDVGNFPKFCPPTVSGGTVYLPSFPGPTGKVTLPERAIEGPALANLNDTQLALAWTGDDPHHSLNVDISQDGRSFGNKVTLAETSPHGPAAAFGNGRLFLAWTGTDPGHHLNVISATENLTFSGKITLSEGSTSAPALAFGFGRLYMAWTDSQQRLNIIASADGITWGGKVTLSGASSRSGPGLAFLNGLLYLCWAGTDANGSFTIMDSADGLRWNNQVVLTTGSDGHPALVARDELYLVWTGRAQDSRLSLLVSESTPAELTDRQTFDDTSIAPPAVTVFKGDIHVAWTGTDPAHSVNAASLSTGYVSAYGLLS
jgi:hypothetical protein